MMVLKAGSSWCLSKLQNFNYSLLGITALQVKFVELLLLRRQADRCLTQPDRVVDRHLYILSMCLDIASASAWHKYDRSYANKWLSYAFQYCNNFLSPADMQERVCIPDPGQTF